MQFHHGVHGKNSPRTASNTGRHSPSMGGRGLGRDYTFYSSVQSGDESIYELADRCAVLYIAALALAFSVECIMKEKLPCLPAFECIQRASIECVYMLLLYAIS